MIQTAKPITRHRLKPLSSSGSHGSRRSESAMLSPGEAGGKCEHSQMMTGGFKDDNP